MSDQPDLGAIWAKFDELLHEGDINRSLWDAARIAIPLALEDDLLVVGFEPGKMRDASYLTSGANRPLVMASLEAAVGRRVNLETIEGNDPDAWQREKARRELAIEMAQNTHEGRQVKGSQIVWLNLSEKISEVFGSARERRFPLSRARTLIKALKMTVETEEKARAEEPDNDELHTQQLNRTIDRIATFAELPSTMVAVEYLRARQTRQ